MALFRTARREREAPGPSPASPSAAAPTPEAPAAAWGSSLAVALREIAAAALAPEDALQPALEAIIEAAGATAGAVCLYDSRRELLRLAVESGFSDEGCKRLRNVRRNDPVTWDMPLNALLNRRVYLIDNASQNRYVPPLLDPAGTMRTVVCIPLLAGVNPLGSIILIAAGARVIHERSIQALQDGLRELATLIESVRRQATGETPVPDGSPPPSPFVPKAGGTSSGSRTVTVSTRTAADAQALADRIASAKARRPQEPEAAADLPAGPPHPAPSETAAEIARVRETLALVEAARDQARAEVARLATDVEDLAAQLTAAVAERSRSETLLREAAERAEATAAGERQRREEAETALQDRTIRADPQPALEQAWADLRRAIQERDTALAEVERLTAEVRRLETELQAATEERERLASAELASRGRTTELEHALEAEQTSLREAEEREQALALQLSAAGAERLRLEEEAESLRGREAANLERIAEVEARITALQTAKSESTTAMTGLEEQIQAFEQQCATLADQNRALAARLEELVGAAARVPELPADAPPPAPAESTPDPAPETVAPTRSARVVVLRTVRPESQAAPGTLVIVGGGPAWDNVATPERQVVRLDVGADLPGRLAELPPSRVLIDLAVAGALDAIAAARAAGCSTRFWGCVSTGDGSRALRLGMIEPTPRPLDPDAVLGLLSTYAARGTRVFTAGADADALISLRQALSREGMSVSIAWDGKQAIDMLGVVRPEAAVVDLEIPPREGFGLILQLGALDPVSSVIVIHGGEDVPAGFAAAIADRTVQGRVLPLGGLAADVLKRSEAPVAERR